jgi:peptide-methionine (R)-S-oxide reductase
MNRRAFLTRAPALSLPPPSSPCEAQSAPTDRVVKTPEEWRKTLTPEQYYILREEGTERPYSSPA